MKTLHFFLVLLFILPLGLQAQNDQPDLGQVTGNVSLLWQSYQEDEAIQAAVPPEKAAMNAWANLIYTRGKFSAGLRYEGYNNALVGFPGRFKGNGIGYRFARYNDDMFDVTIGSFYEQFGSGMVFRSYEERFLGIDNAMDGFRVIFKPIQGVTIKGIYGRQRLDFDSRLINGDGVIRGFDGELNINQLFEDLSEKELQVSLGGSFVSKFQTGSTIEKDTLFLEVPQNVASYAGRINAFYKGFNLYGEYVRKINDPSADNGYIYREGEGFLGNLAYSRRGFGFNLGAKVIDNMSFRTDRDLQLLDAPINFLPAITKVHTYNLAATLYPYATVITTGESGYSAEVFKKFKRVDVAEDARGLGSGLKKLYNTIVGKYGTTITANFAAANSLDTTNLVGVEGVVNGYERNSLGFGTTKYIRDLNVEVSRKFSKKFKAKYTYYYLEFNTTTNAVTTDFKGLLFADLHVLELQNKLSKHHSLRTELQTLLTEQDKGDWGTVLFEYSYSPHWFVSVMDQYNFGNADASDRIHYLFGTIGYINGANRLAVGYGKRRAGIFCVGGVCRPVPASNGLEISFTSSF
ncbi:MAG: DUF6029 family protein [Flavobacteriales bacterium]|nr:DUF6029 family protein [Flavobacteriales bacterium]MDG1781415.1 DUF6029 family protein [Flavobacteriales bacterium]